MNPSIAATRDAAGWVLPQPTKLKGRVNKSALTDPDAGNVSTAMTIGDNGFLNSQAWKTKGKKLVTP